MTEQSCHAHVRPQGPATEAPPPTLPVRNRDLVKYRALLLGYNVAQGKDPKGTLDFEAFAAGVEVTLEYLRTWDRRRSALDDVL